MTAAPIQDNKHDFAKTMLKNKVTLASHSISTLQINITKLCNQACVHCHVDSSPRRREAMSDEVIEKVMKIMEEEPTIDTLDITGGAPELHPRFKELVVKVREAGKKVMVRHNLTVTHDPHPKDKSDMSYLPQFFAEYGVELVSSLPYYQEYFTDKQRGSGVFQKSIKSLKLLNELGYGQPGSDRVLNLVYNPVGAFLPPPQDTLEKTYKKELQEKFGIVFNNLFAITNMPIHRFKAQLKRLDGYEDYMERLVNAFNPSAAEGIMCKSLISVAYDGSLFDCDFNQVLDMNIGPKNTPKSILDWDHKELSSRTIKTADHCFGCTAGAGSSCGGNTAD